MNPFAQRVTDILPNQYHKKAIEVDARLRVKGVPSSNVYAIGDCATVCPFTFTFSLSSYPFIALDRDFDCQPLP